MLKKNLVALELLLCFLCGNVFANAELKQADLNPANKALRTQQYNRAFELYRQAALAGDARAQYQLFNMYSQGKGVTKNKHQAQRWLEKSAESGHSAAQYSLALTKLKNNRTEATRLFKASAAQGYAPAKNYLKQLDNAPTRKASGSKLTALWFGAARNNRVDELKKLLALQTNVDLTDDVGRSALFDTIEANASNAFNWLLGKGANPNQRDTFGTSPLALAIINNRPVMLEKLLRKGGDSDQTLPNGDTLLHYAIRVKAYKLVPLLLQHPLKINQKNAEGWTALDLAQYQKASTIIDELTQRGAVNGQAWNKTKTPADGVSAEQILRAAGANGVALADIAKIVVSGNTELMTNLKLQMGAQFNSLINSKLEDGSTLLFLAIKNRNTNMVQALLEAGANPLTKNRQASYPVETAIRIGHSESVDRLLAAMGINNQNTGEPTPYNRFFLLAVKNNMAAQAIKLLTKAAPEARDKQGRNALWYATNNTNIELTQNLLKAGVPADTPDAQGQTAFYTAIKRQCLQCAKTLIKAADINHQTASGETALIAAARNGDEKSTKLLLNNNADIELRNTQGNSALITAVQNNAVEVAKLLVNAGANISRKNKLGYSATDIAEKNNSEILKILRSRSILDRL